jgi:hypothetical protein
MGRKGERGGGGAELACQYLGEITKGMCESCLWGAWVQMCLSQAFSSPCPIVLAKSQVPPRNSPAQLTVLPWQATHYATFGPLRSWLVAAREVEVALEQVRDGRRAAAPLACAMRAAPSR